MEVGRSPNWGCSAKKKIMKLEFIAHKYLHLWLRTRELRGHFSIRNSPNMVVKAVTFFKFIRKVPGYNLCRARNYLNPDLSWGFPRP
jgi:hypothetical protein